MLPILLGAALLAPADTDPVVPPKGVAPTIVVGQIDKAGKFVSAVDIIQYKTETREETVTVNGQQVKRTYTVTVPVMMTVLQTRDLGKATATTAGGKKLDKDALAKRLDKKTAVVFSADGKPVDKGFLALFKPDTVVIVMPGAIAAVMPGRAAPPPPPPVKR